MSKVRFSSAAVVVTLAISALSASQAVHAAPPHASGYREMLTPVMPAVVHVLVDLTSDSPQTATLQQQRLRKPALRRHDGSGSGIIFDAAKGLVLTNNHVVDGAATVTIELLDGRRLPGRIRGTDPATDLALIEIPAERLVGGTLSAEDELQVGDLVFAVGYPFGLQQTVTMGIVSGLGRSTGPAYEDLIQSDVRINPGSSGGALVDARGRVVGITSAAYLDELNDETGINYAIPAGQARRIAKQLEERGSVSRPAIGAEVRTLTPSIVRALELDVQAGVLVTAVRPQLAADKAGLRTGDIIVEVNGRPAHRASEFRNAINVSEASREVRVAVLRERGRHNLRIGFDHEGADRLHLFGAVFAKRPEPGAKGVVVIDMEPQTAGFYSDEEPAISSGLTVGDVLTDINGRPVDDLATLQGAGDLDGQDIVLAVRRGELRILLPIE